MANLQKIKDPLYGYVYFSNLEGRFLSHPLVLRLNHIRQNGAAYLTYPSIRVHRFEHSLGVMHIAGNLFINACRFSEDPGLQPLLTKVITALLGKSGRDVIIELKKASGVEFIQGDGLYRLHDLALEEPGFIQLLLFQAIRIAGLIHDIGHPPFSHTFEMALKQVEPDKYIDHEATGLLLLDTILDDIDEVNDRAMYFFGRYIGKIVRAVLDKEDASHAAVRGLSKIISSDLDADRLDYVRRDTTSAGLTTNAYDLGRLYDAIRLVSCRDADSGREYVDVEYTAGCLSTLEAFFSVRFHQYRWMLWHHNVIRHNMATVIATKLIWQIEDLPTEQARYARAQLRSLALDRSRLREYWKFTDFFLLQTFAIIYEALADPGSERAIAESPNREKLDQLYRCLRKILFREKIFFASFWKRPDDYEAFSRLIYGGEAGNSRRFNEAIARAVENYCARLQSARSVRDRDMKNYRENFIREFCDAMESEINGAIRDTGCQVRAYYLWKFKPAPADLVLRSRKSTYPVEVLSPAIASLNTAWQSLPQLWLFLERPVSISVIRGKTFLNNLDQAKALDRSMSVVPDDLFSAVAKAIESFLEKQAPTSP